MSQFSWALDRYANCLL